MPTKRPTKKKPAKVEAVRAWGVTYGGLLPLTYPTRREAIYSISRIDEGGCYEAPADWREHVIPVLITPAKGAKRK